MIDVDVVLVNMEDKTAYCSDGVTRDIFEMYDAEAKPTQDPDSAIAAVVKVGDDQFILLNLTGEDAAKPKVNTVSLKHLAASLAESHEMPKKQGEAILNDLVNLVTKHLKKGDRIRLAGLGVLVVRKRAARMGRNPATGEPIQIKASKKVAFRAAKELKEAV